MTIYENMTNRDLRLLLDLLAATTGLAPPLKSVFCAKYGILGETWNELLALVGQGDVPA